MKYTILRGYGKIPSMDSDNTNTGIMYADVPARGVNTLYTQIGDMLGWICVAGLVGLILLTMILSFRQKKMQKVQESANEETVLPSPN